MPQRTPEEHEGSDDMRLSHSDVDMDGEDEIQQEVDELDADGAGGEDELAEDQDVEVDDDDEPEENSDAEGASSSPPPELPEKYPEPKPRLRIKLRLPTQASPASSAAATGAATPDQAGPSRRAPSRDVDIESEDEDSDDARSTRSTSVATTATASRPLTARQAVLANVVDSSHVSLAELPNGRKKKPLTEIEIALKREETARKRRNLSEKKLEDEKAETINRLLKKQSRSKGKRNALSTADDRPSQLASVLNAADADEEDSSVPATVISTKYRWVSSAKADPSEDGQRKMLLTFSVPLAALPTDEQAPAKMDVDGDELGQARSLPLCDIHGCAQRRKYRLVKDWEKGACGIEHLKLLETVNL